MVSDMCHCGHPKSEHDDYGCKHIIFGIDVRNCKCNYKHKKYRDSLNLENEMSQEETE